MTRSTAFQSLALSVLITSGCQATLPLHAMRQPIFAVGPQGERGEVAIATRPNATVGGLTVSFQGELAQWTRRVLATVADVEKVIVTVTPAGAPEVSQAVLKAAIANGQTSVTFQGLPPGTATITITAFDVFEANIGSVTRSASIVVGQVSTVDVTLQLAPTTPTGGSAGGPPTVGSLSANVTVLEGPVVTQAQSGQVGTTIPLGFYPSDVEIDAQGNAWVGGSLWVNPYTSAGAKGVVAKFSPEGTLLQRILFDAPVTEMTLDNQGHLIALFIPSDAADTANRVIRELNADGQVMQTAQVPVAVGDQNMFMDSLGGAWLSGNGYMHLIALSGFTSGFSSLLSFGVRGANQDIWVTGGLSGPVPEKAYVLRYAHDGTELGRYPAGQNYESSYCAVDAAGNAWVTAWKTGNGSLSQGKLIKLTATGQEVLSVDMQDWAPYAVAVGSDGTVWTHCFDGGSAAYVVRYSPQGTQLSAAMLPWHAGGSVDFLNLAVGSSGGWVMHPMGQHLSRVLP